MSDRKDIEKVQLALDTTFSNLKDDPWLAQKVLANAKGETRVRRKISVGFVLVIVLVLAFATFAVAITLNLFEQYGKNDQRLSGIASEAVITPIVSTITNEATSPSTVSITNAYYDGSSLLVAYMIEKPEQIAYYQPTDEQLKQMELTDSASLFEHPNDLERPYEDAFRTALQQGSSFGIMRSEVFLSGDTYSENGIHLGTWNEYNEYSDSSLYSCIRDFDSLPEEACNLEQLSIVTSIHQKQTYFYYDGNNIYTKEAQVVLQPVSVAIQQSKNEIRRFAGDTIYNGAKLYCTIEETTVHLSAKITWQGQNLPELPEGYYYDMCLQDSDGDFIEASASLEQGGQQTIFTFNGTGQQPDIQIASLLIVGDESGTEAIDIVITEKMSDVLNTSD